MVQKCFSSEKLQHFSLRKPILVANEVNTDINAYTDGSKFENGVGCAFCVINGSQVIREAKHKLSNYFSVFRAELFAILNAVKYINKKFIAGDHITVCTDSQSLYMH
jgi:ribonuclease HI